ncbi:MAG: aminotransferase class V-fold PLP-dependent enzyme, partial [Lentisphaeria bacterium]|nr:aminotransferase class V-fold PLP-dependent enzyme [Lentisphaeria bacterium]
MLAWASELGGGPAPVPAGNAGNDWARLASDVVRGESAAASSEAYSPTLVSASKAGAASAVDEGEKAVPRSRAAVGTVPVDTIRADFPILSERLDSGRTLIWFDNGATTQRPRQVIDRISHYYLHENSNVHRGAHELAARSTDAYENARSTVAKFLGAGNAKDIVFVRGTTEGINLVAQSYVRPLLRPGDEIIVSLL